MTEELLHCMSATMSPVQFKPAIIVIVVVNLSLNKYELKHLIEKKTQMQ